MKERIKILIVEDEALIAENLKISLNSLGYNTKGIVNNALDALDFLLKNEVDFAILDINIKGKKSGIWLAEHISKSYDIPFIFLTAYSDSETLSKALKTKPSGYLVKPFVKENIAAAIEVALTNFVDNTSPKINNIKVQDFEEKILKSNNTSFFIKHKNIYFKVNFIDLLFLESDNNYVKIITKNKEFLVRNSLLKVSNELPPNFIQVHRSFYVNKDNIDKIDPMSISIGTYKIPVSNSFKKMLLNTLNKFN